MAEMFFRAGPLVIKSQIELPLLRVSQSVHNATFRRVERLPWLNLPRVGAGFPFLWSEQGVWLFHDEAATGFVSVDSDVQILDCRNELSLYTTCLLALRVLSVQQGALLLHGSAVARNGVASVWIGESGSGKSTKAAIEALTGAVHVNDDIVPLIFDDQGRVCTFQLDRFANLLDNSNSILRELYAGLPASHMARRDGKFLYQLSCPDGNLYPLGGINWLQGNGNERQLNKTSNQSIELLLHSIIGRGEVQKLVGRRHLEIIAQLLEQISTPCQVQRVAS
jgi:hypothetical protein